MEESVKIKTDTSLVCNIELTDFADKLSGAKVGQKLESRPLELSWSTFTIEVYLRGESKGGRQN